MPSVVNGVELEKFLALEGQIVEPVPQEERERYVYWRAAHLGSIALNFIKGFENLNSSWGANYAHFWKGYYPAVLTARGLVNTEHPRRSQFGEKHISEFAELTGNPETFVHPAIIFALDEQFNDGSQLEELKEEWSLMDAPLDEETFSIRAYRRGISPGGGHMLYGALRLEYLDPHSKNAIEGIFRP